MPRIVRQQTVQVMQAQTLETKTHSWITFNFSRESSTRGEITLFEMDNEKKKYQKIYLKNGVHSAKHHGNESEWGENVQRENSKIVLEIKRKKWRMYARRKLE